MLEDALPNECLHYANRKKMEKYAKMFSGPEVVKKLKFKKLKLNMKNFTT